MAKYMIHTMPKRKWYVDDYLIPSMLKQGVKPTSISVYCDEKQEGNLRACMNAFILCENKPGGTWHLQDDVILCHNFKEMTEKYDEGIVCGFKSKYDGINNERPIGRVPIDKMWFSFPCIRIPNAIASNCGNWVLKYMVNNPVYKEWTEKGVNDDLLFRQYVLEKHKDMEVLNIAPNLIDHIDYLIGGTVNSNARQVVKIRSVLWEDEYLVRELEQKLKTDNRN